jgi:hypothetical protein
LERRRAIKSAVISTVSPLCQSGRQHGRGMTLTHNLTYREIKHKLSKWPTYA